MHGGLAKLGIPVTCTDIFGTGKQETPVTHARQQPEPRQNPNCIRPSLHEELEALAATQHHPRSGQISRGSHVAALVKEVPGWSRQQPA